MSGEIKNMPMDEYLAMPAVSASVLIATESQCPYAGWYQSWLNTEREAGIADKAQDAGSIAHAILLEGSEAAVSIIDPNDHPAEKTGAIPTGWTNKSIKLARDAAREQGKIPILLDDMLEIRDMVSAARRFIDLVKIRQPTIWAMFQPNGGDSELTITWQDGKTPCRIRPDRISTDRRIIVDYKTGGTTAEPNTWGRLQMIRMSYYVSAAFYQRGVQSACNVIPAYVWLVQEQSAPFLCSLVGLGSQASERGHQRVQLALRTWEQCAVANDWPAYPADIVEPEFPAYEDARVEAEMYSDKDLGLIPGMGTFDDNPDQAQP